MKEHLIAEQIDVIVTGDMRLELLSLMLDRPLPQQPSQMSKNNRPSYLEALKKLLRSQDQAKDTILPSKTTSTNGLIIKKTKIILTQSFWLHIHFFVQDNRLFDPFIFDANKGGITICILAGEEHANLTEAKNYLLHQNNGIVSRDSTFLNGATRDQNAMIKPETIIEGKIYNMIHEREVSGFPSVLAVKISEEGRIIEESSNLRLTVNQISRWIMDRHFENYHRIKIK